MHPSSKTLIGGLLALSLLASPAIAAPVSAHAANPGHHRGAARRQTPGHRAGRRASKPSAHPRRACHRRAECATGTGGTPVGRPTGPRSTSRPRQAARHDRTLTRRLTPKAPPPASEQIPAGTRRAAADTAAVIAAVLASPCANTELTPSAEDLPLVRAAVLCLINRERAEHGLSPLTTSRRLEAAAEGHSAELISADYFAHVSPAGETPVDRIRKTGFIPGPSVGYVIGENLAWGTYTLSTPQSIVSAWLASPGHLANILESQYTQTGIGIVPAVPTSVGGGAPGATYAQEFGVIIH